MRHSIRHSFWHEGDRPRGPDNDQEGQAPRDHSASSAICRWTPYGRRLRLAWRPTLGTCDDSRRVQVDLAVSAMAKVLDRP